MVSKKLTTNKKWWLIGGVSIACVLILGFCLYFFGVFDNKSVSSIDNKVKVQEAENTGKSFNKSELAKYNGQGGQPSYVAVSGVVYDVSVVFKNGSHHSHQAGEELTDAFYSKHVAARIQKYPVVGLYQE